MPISAPVIGWLLELVAAVLLLVVGFYEPVRTRATFAAPFGLWLLGHLIGGPGL